MTSFRVESFPFVGEELRTRAALDTRFRNWPVVYLLNDTSAVYVGETLNLLNRLGHHLDAPDKKPLTGARVVIDETFNKSVCLDLESYLIRLLAGDGRFQVLNRNEGITNADYYGRAEYQKTFTAIFDALRDRGLFERHIREIENSDLFKLSPFKALTHDQEIAVEDILDGLFQDIADRSSSRIVIQGDPGTGKTVVGIYLMKLLSDIQHAATSEVAETESILAEFFLPDYVELLRGFRIGLIVPQQSLRKSIQRVFAKTPGLTAKQVMSPFELGNRAEHYDLLIVDEAHRLNQRAPQAAGPLNRMFKDINVQLFGEDDLELTQLDWIAAMSKHQVFLVDGDQSVRPADLAQTTIRALVDRARHERRHYSLTSQMRVKAGQDYVGYVKGVLAGTVTEPDRFGDYDLRFFDHLGEMRSAILDREKEHGLSRLLAGYAWKWASKNDESAFDIELDGTRLRWNSTDVDWVNSPNSIDEVGSIHTIQGYDLNYAGVVIGPDLRFDETTGRTVFDRESYQDPRGVTNNRARGIVYSDDDILQFVRNIYAVLLTRGILGTYVYVCDPALRHYLRRFFAGGEVQAR